MENFQKIAVLIDADNTQLSKLEAVLHEVSTYGRIVVKKAYGNWRKDSLKNWEPELKRLAIRAEQQFDYVTGKTRPTRYGHRGHGSVAQYVRRARARVERQRLHAAGHRLRESGLRDIGAGVTTTPESFKNACDDFHPPIDYLSKADEARVTSVEHVPRSPRGQKARPQDEKGHTQHEKAGGRIYPGRRTGAGSRARTGARTEKARHPRDPQPAAHCVREVSGRRRLCQRQLLGAVYQAREARF